MESTLNSYLVCVPQLCSKPTTAFIESKSNENPYFKIGPGSAKSKMAGVDMHMDTSVPILVADLTICLFVF